MKLWNILFELFGDYFGIFINVTTNLKSKWTPTIRVYPHVFSSIFLLVERLTELFKNLNQLLSSSLWRQLPLLMEETYVWLPEVGANLPILLLTPNYAHLVCHKSFLLIFSYASEEMILLNKRFIQLLLLVAVKGGCKDPFEMNVITNTN